MPEADLNRSKSRCYFTGGGPELIYNERSDVSSGPMNILLAGVNYKTAPVSFREKLAFDYDQMVSALRYLKVKYSDCGFVLLSTCNRVELYCSVARGSELSASDLVTELAGIKKYGDCAAVYDAFYCMNDRDAVCHLLEVASSLDSLVLGESQIIAQVRDAYYAASRVGATDKVLNRLFHCAFTCSKEVYSTTSISQRRVSVASVAVYLAAKELGCYVGKKAVVIGVGEMGELLICHLKNAGCNNITVVNRTIRRSQLLAERLGLDYVSWDDLSKAVAEADIIIAAANAGEVIFDSSILPEGDDTKKVIIDIAVPRNFEASIGELDNITLFSIDDLAVAASDNMQARKEDIDLAREIVNDDADSFIDWFGVMDVGPVAGRLRDKFHQMAEDELRKLYSCMKPLDETSRQQVDASVKRLVNKYLHSLVNGFYQHAREVDPHTVIKLMEQVIEQEHRGKQ